MPVLDNNTPWPPPPWDVAYQQWRLNAAWHSGDEHALRRAYAGADRTAHRATHVVRGQDHQGGLVGMARSAFWGRPVPPGETRTRLHIPAASDIASLSADLLFSEPPAIRYPDRQGEATIPATAQARLDELLASDQARAMLLEGGEYAAAFGAAALRCVWDEATSERVWVEASAADVTLPEFRYGRLTALNLWTEYRDGSVYYRHVERHEAGAVFHTLYQGTDQNLGHVVPLADRPETEGFAALVNSDGLIPTGIPYLTAAWWVNMPARLWRKHGVLAEAGRSDYAGGVMGLFDALDEAWSSWMRDLELGKARLIVPRAYLQSNGRGQGASFDSDREVFSPLDIPGQAGAQADITQVQFQIRVQEHEQTTQALYRRILASCGYGELDKETLQARQNRTATEVNQGTQSRERTRDRKGLHAKQALADIARVAMLLDAVQFRGKGGGDFGLPDIVFPPASQQDLLGSSQALGALRAARLVSTETGIRMAHPDWDDIQVNDELDRLAREDGVQDPSTVGQPPQQDPNAPPGETPAERAARVLADATAGG